jgi:hypothetical protein
MKHTPGPWKTESFSQAESGESVTLELHANSGYIGTFALELDGNHTPEDVAEFLANGRLIAAAPELLEALEAVNEAFHRQSLVEHRGDVMPKVWAAIRKAKGERD